MAPLKNPKRINYKVIEDGEWVRLTLDHYLACCDCGLVHRITFKIVDGKLFMRPYRDEDATKKRRKAKGIKLPEPEA